MAKISPVAAKYIVYSQITINGVVDKPDVIGAIFGQTEGLLGADLELRELQRSGRIGRIEVSLNTMAGKTSGEIIIPSSLDRVETSIIAAALEVIERIGPCTAKVETINIEDVRVTKRNSVIERAKSLLKDLTEKSIPDSQELTDEVAQAVRVMEIQEYGRERLPSGPLIDESDEIIVVEGRADVLNLLKHGIKNSIALNGTSVPNTIKELSKKKVLTVFVDGDRGGNLILKELLNATDIDFVCRAPDGKEVEELTKKEIHKSLRGKITAEQIRMEFNGGSEESRVKKEPVSFVQKTPSFKKVELSSEEKKKLRLIMDDLFGTKATCLLDEKLAKIGRVPFGEVVSTAKSLGNKVRAVVIDGIVDKNLIKELEAIPVPLVLGTEILGNSEKITLLSDEEI